MKRPTSLHYLVFFLFATFFTQGQNHSIDLVIHSIEDLYPNNSLNISTHTDWSRSHYHERIAHFKENPLQQGAIVFLGNSITEQAGDWNERLEISTAENRGISGDTTEGVLARLDEIIYYNPTQLFILIGVNDMFHDHLSASQIHQNILTIVDKVAKGSPTTQIFVQTILPTTNETLIEKIKQTNKYLLQSEITAPYTLIPLHDSFVLEDGTLKQDLSWDGIHLNEKGYQLWQQQIQDFVDVE
jgi:lysophospholipase L1-like esterase